MAHLIGSLERITFHNPDTGYSVLKLQEAGKRQLATVVGKFVGVQIGETLELEGDWTAHPSHGRQFQVKRWQSVLPADIDGIRKYLGSGLIKGIGPVTAQRIVDTFGADTLRIIEQRPRKLHEVPGLGRKKIDDIVRAWMEQRSIRSLMALLQSYDIAPTLAIRIYRKYGDEAVAVVRQSPYRLADEVFGISFEIADKIARSQGVRLDDPWRVGAGVRHVLGLAAGDGHCFLPLEELAPRAAKVLEIDEERIRTAVDTSDIAGEIQVDEVEGVRLIYLLPFYRAELGTANAIRGLQLTPSHITARFRQIDWSRLWDEIGREQGIALTEKQQLAVRTALTTKISVLTGGPGTGKTQTMRTLITLLDRYRCRYVLASPTGRAAKRLSEASGAEAKTIHRLLEYSPTNEYHFKRDRDNPLEADFVVIDEASMLDILLCNSLLKAVPPEAHVLFVGDADQLPSVGPGNVLRDLIDSWSVSTVHLDVIFRQAADSGIITNAHRINHGEQPELRGMPDFFFFPRPQADQCADMVVELVAERITRKFGYDRRSIQVLAPMHKGASGVQSLNDRLQAALNPSQPGRAEKTWGSTTFRVGDRVMQIRNNYDLDVYNGDVGEVVEVDQQNESLSVRFDEVSGPRVVNYAWTELDELQLAYATSIHKAQGAEYPVVVVPLVQQHWALLQRNLIYTAVTRAKSLVVLVGDERSIAYAVRNHTIAARFTSLGRRLRVGG